MLEVKSKDLEEDNNKRSCYSDGVAAKSSKLSSVNRIFAIGIIPGCQENYQNIKRMLQYVRLSGLPVTFSCDLKLGYFLEGKSGGNGRHNCTLCCGCSPWTGDCSLLTIGDLKRHHEQYVAAGSDAEAFDYQNCINPCLLEFPEDTLVLDVLNIPELHLPIGIGSKHLEYIEASVCDPLSGKKEDKGIDMERKAAARQWVDGWLEFCNITRPAYKGGRTLEGNAAKKLLSEDSISELRKRARTLPLSKAFRVIAATKSLDCFRDVVHYCFGNTIKVKKTIIFFFKV